MHSYKIKTLRAQTNYPVIRSALNVGFLIIAIGIGYLLINTVQAFSAFSAFQSGVSLQLLSSVLTTASCGLLSFLIWQFLHVLLDIADHRLNQA